MHHQGGGTFIAADSVPVVAAHLAEHPEGVLSTEFDFLALTRQCHEFVELTGQAGDVVLMHPFMLHATSQNVIGHGRLITNPPITLREPMRFDRADPGELSPSSVGCCAAWVSTASTSSAPVSGSRLSRSASASSTGARRRSVSGCSPAGVPDRELVGSTSTRVRRGRPVHAAVLHLHPSGSDGRMTAKPRRGKS